MSCFHLRKKYPDSFTHLLFLCPAARVFMILLYFYGSFTSNDTLHHLIYHGHHSRAQRFRLGVGILHGAALDTIVELNLRLCSGRSHTDPCAVV